jgi:hypothetical protein
MMQSQLDWTVGTVQTDRNIRKHDNFIYENEHSYQFRLVQQFQLSLSAAALGIYLYGHGAKEEKRLSQRHLMVPGSSPIPSPSPHTPLRGSLILKYHL